MQIRDLDQTVIGNPAHDLVRLALSLAMAARSSDLPGVTTARVLEHMIDGYEAAFTPDLEEGDDVPRTVKLVMREAEKRSWEHLADERIEGTKPAIPLGKRFWPLGGNRARCTSNAVRERGNQAPGHLATFTRRQRAGSHD